MSIDKFYEIVTGDKHSFKKLIEILPTVMDDVIDDIAKNKSQSNTVLSELAEIDSNILKSLYLLSFKSYEGFDTLDFQ